MSDIDMGGLLGTVIVGGIAIKMADTLLNKQQPQQQQQSTSKKKISKKQEANAYTRNNAAFSNKYSPF